MTKPIGDNYENAQARDKTQRHKNTFQWILVCCGRILAATSLIKLLWETHDWGLARAGSLLLEWYGNLTRLLFGWAEKPLQVLLDVLSAFALPELTLQSHWKDIVVLLMAYFGARLRAMSLFGANVRVAFWGSLLVLGTALVILGGIGAGTAPFESQPQRSPVDALLIVYPLVAVFLFDISENLLSATIRRKEVAALLSDPDAPWHRCFWHLARKVAVRFFAASLLVSVFAVALIWLPDLPAPGLLGLVGMLILTGLYWLVQGAQTVAGRRRVGESWRSTYLRLGSTRVGVEIAYVIGGIVFFALMNAGLKLVGL